MRADVTAPYTGSPATWYRYVHRHQEARAAAAAPVIRFEGLPGEFLEVDWGEAHVQLGKLAFRGHTAEPNGAVPPEVGAPANVRHQGVL